MSYRYISRFNSVNLEMAYLYRHIRLDKNVPFYIGIGADSEGKYTRAFNTSNRNIYWKNITSISRYEVEILIDDISYDFAAEKEKEFIALYGRKNTKGGTLCNLTDGGDKGVVGMVVSEETKKKLSIINMGKVRSRESVEKTSRFHRGRKRSIETCKKLSKVRQWRYGEIIGTSKVTNTVALEIANSTLPSSVLCKMYGLTKCRISAIRTGREWSKVTGIKYAPFKTLSERVVLKIYNSPLSGNELSEKYNTPKNTISSIRTGRNWGWLTKKEYTKSYTHDKRI